MDWLKPQHRPPKRTGLRGSHRIDDLAEYHARIAKRADELTPKAPTERVMRVGEDKQLLLPLETK